MRFELLGILARVSTRVSILRSRFDLFHAARGQLLPIDGSGVAHDLVERLVPGQAHDLVRRKARLGRHPTEGLAKAVGVQVIG
jgi:hypothetical protein